MDKVRIQDLYDLSHTRASALLGRTVYPWEALAGIGDAVREIGVSLDDAYECRGEGIYIARSACIAPNAVIMGPCVIGERTQVRPGAFIRGNVLVGDDAVIGNSTELKNCILFDGVQVPHYNYVGDSILGYRAHMGAGAVTSNVRGDKKDVVIHGEAAYATNRKKVGAMIGDEGEVGCNAVLNPGTVLGRGVQVYPLSCVRGVIPAQSIVKGERGVFPKN